MVGAKAPSAADVLRLGASVAGVKANTKPADWAKLVNTAHAKGFTVAGMLSGQPDALKERLQSSLKTQAQKSISDSYAPAEQQLNDSQSRILNLDTKRQSDNVAYQSWLAAQTAQQAAQGQAADTQLASVAGTVQQQTRDAWAKAGTDAKATAAASPGNVSNPNQSTALNFASERAAQGAERTGAAANNALAGISSGQSARVLTAGALTGQMEASKATQKSATQQALQGVIDDKSKLAIAKAGDTLSEFKRLQQSEIDKATNAQNLEVAAHKLNVTQDIAANRITASTQIAASNRQSADNRAAARIALDKGKSDLNGDGLVNAADYKLKKSIDKQYGTTKSSAPSASAVTNSRNQYQVVGSIQDLLNRWHTTLPVDPTTHKPISPKDFRNTLESKPYGFSQAQINLANDLWKNKGKLSKSGLAQAIKLEILFPEKLWGTK